MLYNDVILARYVGDGPAYADETDDQATGENAAYYLGGHLLTRPAPGHGFEDEPTDDAEKASQHVAQNAAQAAEQAPALDHAAMARSIRQALRPGN